MLKHTIISIQFTHKKKKKIYYIRCIIFIYKFFSHLHIALEGKNNKRITIMGSFIAIFIMYM